MLYQQSDDDHVTGSFDKEAVYDKKYSKKIYICQNNLIASVVVETEGGVLHGVNSSPRYLY